MPTMLQRHAQDHGCQPDTQGDQGGRGLPHPQALLRSQKRDDDEDGPEQDRLGQVGGHGPAPDGGGEPSQSREPTVRRRPTGVEGEQRQPAAGTHHTEDLLHGDVPRPLRDG